MGLTLGFQQEFDIRLASEKMWIGKQIYKVLPQAGQVRDKIIELRNRQTAWLFGPYITNLKAGAFLLEYMHLLKKNREKILSGEVDRMDLAKNAADLMNDDFGGLNHKRIRAYGFFGPPGRSKTVQQLLGSFPALAIDWSESNIGSMAKAFRLKKDAEIYRRFWARIALRLGGATILFNFLIAGWDDDTFWERYQKAWKAGHLRWLEVDITPIHRALGGESGTREYFSLIGHFRDPVKFMVDPFVKTGLRKGSVLTRMALTLATGEDWRGRRITTNAEFFGIDDKGVYGKGPRHGLRKGGKLKWQLTTYGQGKPFSYDTAVPMTLHLTKSVTPIMVQAAIDYLLGEIHGMSAITRGAGQHTSSVKEAWLK